MTWVGFALVTWFVASFPLGLALGAFLARYGHPDRPEES